MSEAGPTSAEPHGTGRAMTRGKLLATGATGALAAYGLTASGAAARGMLSRAVLADTVTLASYEENAGIPASRQTPSCSRSRRASTSRPTPSTMTRSRSRSTATCRASRDDVFTWFAGYRMQFFARRACSTPIDDVWKTLTPQLPPAMKAPSKGLDGHYYFVPIYNYPWAVFYRKSVFEDERLHGPDDLGPVHRARQEDEGRRPDPDRLHRQGRLAGDGHVRHPQHAHQRLRLPRRPDGGQGSVGQRRRSRRSSTSGGAPAVLLAGRARPHLAGGRPAAREQAGRHVPARLVRRAAVHEAGRPRRPRLLRVPVDQPEVGAGLDRRSDRRLHAVRRGRRTTTAPKQLLGYLGTAAAENIYLATDPNDVGANKDANKAHYTALQKKAAALIASAKHIAQYMDRDTRPDFASTVMIPSLQTFLNNPDDVNRLVKSIQKQKKAIFGI